MAAKAKSTTTKKRVSTNSAEFERDVEARHGDKSAYKPGRYTRVFEVVENGIPLVDHDHQANKAFLVEEARNKGVRVTAIDDVTLDEDEYLDNGKRRLVYSGPVAEVMPVEQRSAEEDKETDPLDPMMMVSHDANPKPGEGQMGQELDPAAVAKKKA
jgi:hypothetical protein